MRVCDICRVELVSCCVFHYGVDPINKLELCGDCTGELNKAVQDKISTMTKAGPRDQKETMADAVKRGFRSLMEGGR